MAIVNRNRPKIKRQEEETPTNIHIETSGFDEFIRVLLQFQISKRTLLKVGRWIVISIALFLLYFLGTLNLPGTRDFFLYLLHLLTA